jgi:hypothetical protein
MRWKTNLGSFASGTVMMCLNSRVRKIQCCLHSITIHSNLRVVTKQKFRLLCPLPAMLRGASLIPFGNELILIGGHNQSSILHCQQKSPDLDLYEQAVPYNGSVFVYHCETDDWTEIKVPSLSVCGEHCR